MIMILARNWNTWSMEEQYRHVCSIRYQSGGWLIHSILEIITRNLLRMWISISQWYPMIKTFGRVERNHFIEIHWHFLLIKRLWFLIIYITYVLIVTKDSFLMWERPMPIIMILCQDNSSTSCSLTTKYFLYVTVKRKTYFFREIIFHQSSHRYLTYSNLTFFTKWWWKGYNVQTFKFSNSIWSICL